MTELRQKMIRAMELKNLSPNSCGLVLTGLRFFYTHVTDEKLRVDYRMRKKNQKLPTVLSQEQVANIIGACDNLKHRLILMSTYAAGLRTSEVAGLKPEHIDSERMLIKVVQG